MSLLDRLNKRPEPEKEPAQKEPAAAKTAAHPQHPAEQAAAPALTSEQQASADVLKDIEENVQRYAHLAPATPGELAGHETQRAFLEKVLSVHRKLINESDLDFNKFNLVTGSEEELQKITATLSHEILVLIDSLPYNLTRKEKGDMIEAVLHETIGLGPIEDLVKDDTVTEIMVNGSDHVYVERNGRIEKTPCIF